MLALGVVIWLFLQENRRKDEKEKPNLLKRLGLEGKQEHGSSGIEKQQALKPPVAIDVLSETLPDTGREDQTTTSIQTTSDPELLLKYERLEALFKEKGEELEKKEKTLENELKARKDFNKVKDVFEKELKDVKDKNHKLQLELTASQSEVENSKKRGLQLEDKINSKEHEIKEKEQQIDDLLKRLKAFATPSVSQAPTQAKTGTPETPQTPPQEKTEIKSNAEKQEPPAQQQTFEQPDGTPTQIEENPKKPKDKEQKQPSEQGESKAAPPEEATQTNAPKPSEQKPEQKSEAPEKEKTFTQGEPIRQPPRQST